jgi:CheY-like chemotaxis protein
MVPRAPESMRLIIVENDPVLRLALAKVLKHEGMQVLAQSADGAEALEAMQRLTPDVILTDCDMPHVDGIEFVQRLRAAGDQTPVVMLSGQTEPATIAHATAAGVNRYLIKPVSAQTLSSVLRQTWRAAVAA